MYVSDILLNWPTGELYIVLGTSIGLQLYSLASPNSLEDAKFEMKEFWRRQV